jgi:drug/metabolite transporter (DMT)-like permease
VKVQTPPLRRPVAVLCALASVLIWGVNYPAMKVAFREIDPLAFTGWRFLIATSLLVLEAVARREPLLPPPGARGLGVLLALSGVGIYQWFYALGLASTSGFNASLLNSVSPLISVLLVVLLGWERFSALGAAGSAIAWTGVALFVRSTHGEGLGSTKGNLFCLAAAFFWALFNVVSSRVPGRMSPSTAQAVTFAGGTVVVLSYALPGMLRQDYRHVGATSWTILVLSAILPLALAFRLWPAAIASLGVAQASSFGFLVPVLAGVTSALWTGETFDAAKVLSALVVLAGLALTQVGGQLRGTRR